MPTGVCDRHGGPLRGRSCSFYPALFEDGKRLQAKWKLCRDCVSELLTDHRKDWLDSLLDSRDGESNACYCCGKLADSLSSLRRLYVTVYVDGKTRRDYASYYCDDCAEVAKHEFKLQV
jgi:hypothetical protein